MMRQEELISTNSSSIIIDNLEQQEDYVKNKIRSIYKTWHPNFLEITSKTSYIKN